MLKEVATDIKHHRLSSPNHGLCITNARKGTKQIHARRKKYQARKAGYISCTNGSNNRFDHIRAEKRRKTAYRYEKCHKKQALFRMPEIRYKTAQRVAYVFGAHRCSSATSHDAPPLPLWQTQTTRRSSRQKPNLEQNHDS